MRKEVGEKLTIGGTRRSGVQREFGDVDVAGESVLMVVYFSGNDREHQLRDTP